MTLFGFQNGFRPAWNLTDRRPLDTRQSEGLWMSLCSQKLRRAGSPRDLAQTVKAYAGDLPRSVLESLKDQPYLPRN